MNTINTGRPARARLMGCAAAAALWLAAGGAAKADFTLDDIHFWVGEGTNRAAVVVDWSEDGASPLAWGYRWNGEATLADALTDIVREDHRLHAFAEEGEYGLSLYAMGYDRADVAAEFFFDYNGGYIVALASDADALAAGGWYMGYWAQWFAPVGDSLDADMEALHYGAGLSFTPLEDRSWHVLQFQRPEWEWAQHPLSGEPDAAESPYAWRVAAADVEPDQPSWDGAFTFGDVSAALGRPSLSTAGWGDTPDTPVVPVNPAYGPDRLVTLVSATNPGAGGSITLEFDHGILDDPRNPFGLDFIVFGNAMQTLGGGRYWSGTEDPTTVAVATDTLNPERGLVEVSADGVTWFAFTDGPYADDFAPTISHLCEPDNPDGSLFEGNLWWGAPADATRPVDPALAATDFKGRTVADYARLYDGSAGGTGFDISGFDLPSDGQGRKYVRFVRITTLEPGDDTEVDAVADVSPAPSFRYWVDANFPFEERPGVEKSTLCANGAPAYLNAAFGRAPDAPAPAGWTMEGFDPAAGILATNLAPYAADLVDVRCADDLAGGTWTVSLPFWDALGRPLVPSEKTGPSFFRLGVHD